MSHAPSPPAAGPAVSGGQDEPAAGPAVSLDLRGVLCPLTWVRTRIALEQMGEGERIDVVLDPGEPLDSVPRSAAEEGHEVERRDGRVVSIVKRSAKR